MFIYYFRLCKLLTSASEVKDMVAEFLFILCKESGKFFMCVK